jgi:choline dehydrogenase-like flavoprotein
LLIDAGGENVDESQQTFGERHWTLMAPGYNWGYKTLPQDNLKGREIDYSRGKGLGGSTAINFCVYTRGPSADYDHWAELVGDDTWRWEEVQKRFNKVIIIEIVLCCFDAQASAVRTFPSPFDRA